MSYQSHANRELHDCEKYVEKTVSTWTMTIVIFLARAAVFALLDIAQAIRESRETHGS